MNCLSCGGTTAELFKLGDFYLPDFIDPGQPRGERYPLGLVMCETCTLVQLSDIVPRGAVIHERYGFTTGLNEQNRADVAEIAHYAMVQHGRFEIMRRTAWLDIGCNDGTLLGSVPPFMHRVGVDPLLNYPNFYGPAREVADDLVIGYFDPSHYLPGQFDVITSTAMFYALDDPGKFTEGVRHVLARDGVWVIQQNYAPDMIRNNTVDNIIHEHVAYYTVRSLQHLMHRYGLEVCDVEYSDVKGGCFRTLVCHRGARPVDDSVEKALFNEFTGAVDDPDTWQKWFGQVEAELRHTDWLLHELAAKDKPAYCYGAGNRGGTLLQLLGVGPDVMPCAVERSPSKVGKVWNSCGLPIISEDGMRADQPGHLLMSPWFFRDVFVDREAGYLAKGGTMIFALPHFELVTA